MVQRHPKTSALSGWIHATHFLSLYYTQVIFVWYMCKLDRIWGRLYESLWKKIQYIFLVFKKEKIKSRVKNTKLNFCRISKFQRFSNVLMRSINLYITFSYQVLCSKRNLYFLTICRSKVLTIVICVMLCKNK